MSVTDTQILATPKLMSRIEFNPNDSIAEIFDILNTNNMPQVFSEETPLLSLVVPNLESNATGPSSVAVSPVAASPVEKTSGTTVTVTSSSSSSHDPKFLEELVKTQWEKLVAIRSEVTNRDAKEAEETVLKWEAYVTKQESKLEKTRKDLEKSRRELEKARAELELKRKRVLDDEDEVNKSKRKK